MTRMFLTIKNKNNYDTPLEDKYDEAWDSQLPNLIFLTPIMGVWSDSEAAGAGERLNSVGDSRRSLKWENV